MNEHRELLPEKEIKQRRLRRALRPYKKGAVRVGRVAARVGGGIVGGLNYLGREGQKSRKPYREAPIDLGFGDNKVQRKYRKEVKSALTVPQRAKVEKLKRRKRASRNRFS